MISFSTQIALFLCDFGFPLLGRKNFRVNLSIHCQDPILSQNVEILMKVTIEILTYQRRATEDVNKYFPLFTCIVTAESHDDPVQL